MAGTVGAARGKRGLAAASASFAGGLALGAAVLFGGLGLLGASFDIPPAVLLALVAGAASAATPVAKPAGDPSVAGTDLVWMQPGVGGFLLRGGKRTPLPGKDPTLGDALIAWHTGDTVTVAASETLTPVLQ